MAIVVENGTGTAGAESYLSVSGLRAYGAGRGRDLTVNDDQTCEVALRLATQWIDTWRRYKGTRIADTEFPRSGLSDWSGTVTGVPKRVRDACAELAIRHLSGTSLVPDADRSNYVKSRSVGPISTTYRDDAPVVPSFTVVERLLEPYVRDLSLNEPYYGGSGDPLFDRGMMSSDGGFTPSFLRGED